MSVPKCAVLHLGTPRINFSYTINNILLPDVNIITDLGVKVSGDLKFRQNIDCLVAKAHQRSSLILRCFKCRDPLILCRAFVTYVRPILEYCSQVWSPSYLTDIFKIERVQRRFTRRLKYNGKLSYGQRLNKINLETLELRRLKFDLIMVYKILHGLIDVNKTIFEFSNSPYLRGHSQKMVKPISRIDCRLHSFVARVVNPWNYLSQQCIDASSVSVFKSCLNSTDFSKFLHVDIN